MSGYSTIVGKSRGACLTNFNWKELSVLFSQAIVGTALISWTLWSSRRGVDFTDEGFYLNWIVNPYLYEASHTLFGFVYHPLYIILGHDLAALRQANIYITVGLAWTLFWLIFSTVLFPTMPDSLKTRLALATLAITFATSALGIFNILWILTPSYNTLALQALMLTSIGVVLAKDDISQASRTGWCFIGVGGWLAFMAKPTTSIMLGLTVFLCTIISGAMRLRHLALALAVSLLLLLASAQYIDGSLWGFVVRLSDGAADLARLNGGYEISKLFRTDSFSFTTLEVCVFLMCLVWLWFAGKSPISKWHHLTWIVPGLTTAFALTMLILCFRRMLIPYWLPFLGLQSLAIPTGAIMLAALHRQNQGYGSQFRQRMGLFLFMLVLPYTFAIGTNGNYWSAEARVYMFWIIAGLVALPPQWPEYLLKLMVPTIGAITLLTTTWVLYSNTENPYRQSQSLRLNKTPTTLATNSVLLLSEDFARYLKQLNDLSYHAGFNSGDPMLDWTGHYPTALHAIGAKPLGLAWLGGGYPGSNEMVAAALNKVPPTELLRAWILTEPEGPRTLSLDLLRNYNIDLKNDYVIVGSLDSPTGTFPKSYKQYLWRPARRTLR